MSTHRAYVGACQYTAPRWAVNWYNMAAAAFFLLQLNDRSTSLCLDFSFIVSMQSFSVSGHANAIGAILGAL